MNEALVRNIGLSANMLRRNQENYPVYDYYALRGNSSVSCLESRLCFPEIKDLGFDPEKLLTAILAADFSVDLGWLKASYPHYRQNPMLGNVMVARSVFATNLDNGGNIVSKACQAIGIPVDLLKDVPGHALTGQTRYQDGSTPGYVLNDEYIYDLIERAKRF